jgi:hypothetical protein
MRFNYRQYKLPKKNAKGRWIVATYPNNENGLTKTKVEKFSFKTKKDANSFLSLLVKMNEEWLRASWNLA